MVPLPNPAPLPVQQQAGAAAKAQPTPGFVAAPISEWGKPKEVPTDTPPAAAAGQASQSGTGAVDTPAPNPGFFTEDELGAEIAAITKSLVQRVMPAAAGVAAVAADALAAGAATAAAEAAAGPKAADAKQAPLASPRVPAQQPQAQSAAPAKPRQASNASGSKKLCLVAAGVTLPHIEKTATGGEDAFFTSSAGCGALGVADGVGGWAEQDVDPSRYSRDIMLTVARGFEAKAGKAGVRELLADAQLAVPHPGSCTACVALLDSSGTLTVANLGDSGARVIRHGAVAMATKSQKHQFNMPYQMASPDFLPDTDTAADALIYQFQLEVGDIVVLASDGLYDNMWDEQLVAIIASASAAAGAGTGSHNGMASSPAAMQQVAAAVANVAFRNAQDASFRSPWSVELANQPSASWLARMFPRGGKVDDITVVVAVVLPA